MLLSGRKSKNFKKLKGQGYDDQMATRDFHDSQDLDRRKPDEVTSPIFSRIGAFIIGVLVTGLLAVVYTAVGVGMDFMGHLSAGNSMLDFQADVTSVVYQPFMYILIGFTFVMIWLIAHSMLMRSWKTENSMADSSDINPHMDDQHIALVEELQEQLDFFPNTGAHSDVSVTSMLSHNMFSNKGVKNIEVAKRYKKDGKDDHGNRVFKGQIILDKNGKPIMESKPMFDEAFANDLFTASGVPKTEKKVRIPYDPKNISYNPPLEGEERKKKPKRKDRDKSDHTTLADKINDDWEFPEYEVQRPGGAYLVDTSPANTMVLAITRAGKGQGVIEPTIDMWTREKRQNNIVINDPKGELMVKFAVPATVRGYELVQFNLINVMKTDIYNPLGIAAEYARAGDVTRCATYVENIGDVFFPVEGADDPMWPNAANNAFKRMAYGLIDYYVEEEKQLRRDAEVNNMPEKVLAQKLDDMWGKVTLYNAYQMFTVLSSKKSSDEEKIKIDPDEEVKEKDFLTLFFDATAKLPNNSIRELVNNADRSLRAMAGSDKTIASCELLLI